MKWVHEVYKWSGFHQSLGGDCLLCGSPAEEGLCVPCRDELPALGAACERCATPLSHTGICGAYQQEPSPFAGAIAAFRYQSPLSDLIISLKFHGRLAPARPLGALFAARLSATVVERPDVIIPVPLHPARLRERGYNQALELARPVARLMGVPLAPNLCVRRRSTASQANLKLEERHRNVRDAFAVIAPIPRRIAIVDDVITTGATAASLARTLQRAGAEEVQLWALARAAE